MKAANKQRHGPEVQQSVLENGIRIVTSRMETVRSIAMGFLFSAGPGDEAPDKEGVAHLTEHLVFQGTRRRSAADIAQMMDTTGGQIGGFTSRDYTCYTTVILDDYRTYSLDLMADLLLNSRFSSSSVQQEKETICHELQAMLDYPDTLAHELLKAHAWQGHPLGRAIGGTVDTVSQLRREDVIGFHSGNYLPDRLIIAAAGNLEHGDMVANIRDGFWSMQGAGTAHARHPRPDFTPGATVEHRNVSHAYFSLGLRAAPYRSDKRYLLHLLTAILGGGISSRLFQRLRREQSLVYAIQAEYQAYRDDGMIVVEGSTAPDLLLEVMRRILGESTALAQGERPFTPEELWRAKMHLKGQHLLGRENSHTCMSSLATQAFYYQQFISSDEILASMDNISLEEMNTAAAELLRQGLKDSALAVVGPGEGRITGEEELGDVLSGYQQYQAI